MRITQCFVVVGLCLLMGACPWWEGEGELDIDIGDYESHLAAWNNQNMPDYQIMVRKPRYYHDYESFGSGIFFNVKNGIPDKDTSSDLKLKEATVPGIYSFIKSKEKKIRDEYKGGNSRYYFKVYYNTEYHYPNKIILYRDNDDEYWEFRVMPSEEGELDIDIGDYETHLAAWNNQNMLDYQIMVRKPHGYYGYDSFEPGVVFNVKNGIPDKVPSSELRLEKATISEIYSFIKEEEERIRNAYNGINRSYLHVKYHTEYHYPFEISLGVGHLFGRYEYWDITLTPGDTE